MNFLRRWQQKWLYRPYLVDPWWLTNERRWADLREYLLTERDLTEDKIKEWYE